jgi:hypothetical protein
MYCASNSVLVRFQQKKISKTSLYNHRSFLKATNENYVGLRRRKTTSSKYKQYGNQLSSGLHLQFSLLKNYDQDSIFHCVPWNP